MLWSVFALQSALRRRKAMQRALATWENQLLPTEDYYDREHRDLPWTPAVYEEKK